jgi:hypothetical protein
VLPILGITTLSQFLDKVINVDGGNKMLTIMGGNLQQSGTFFLRYIISTTFISSCILIFDFGHLFYKRIILLILNGDICKKYKSDDEIQEQKMKHKLSLYKDDWYFDIGQQIALCSIQYFIILLFSQVTPLMTFFGGCFFMNKYLIDKYNVCYNLPIEYIGESRLY